MGFGLLFIGYFLTFFISIAFNIKFVGIIVMLFGLLKLSEYNLKFKRCIPIAGFMEVLSIYMLLYTIFNKIGTNLDIFGNVALNVVSTSEEILNLAFHFFLAAAILSISKETDLPKLSVATVRNLSIMVMGEILHIILLIIKWISPESTAIKWVWYIVLILRFSWILLNLILIAGCYRQICDEGDKDMPLREYKNPVINKMEKVMRKRDENAFEAGQKLTEKRNEKKKNKTKKKKKN